MNKVSSNLKLMCENQIKNKSTCKDPCDDKKYFLRRLQMLDNKLFKYKVDENKKQSQYSRLCQQGDKQPVILDYNPDKRKDIKKESYTSALKHSSNPKELKRWYICPKIWCPICEIPIKEETIDPKTIKIRTKDGIKCKFAMCPNGDHKVMFRENNGKTFEHPGFLENKNPDGKKLPCCFSLSQKKTVKSKIVKPKVVKPKVVKPKK
jgi:hypothetical protein